MKEHKTTVKCDQCGQVITEERVDIRHLSLYGGGLVVSFKEKSIDLGDAIQELDLCSWECASVKIPKEIKNYLKGSIS